MVLTADALGGQRKVGPAPRAKRRFAQARFAYLLLAPALLLVLLVTIVPVGYALVLSVSRTDYLDIVGAAGLAHYASFLAQALGRANVLASLTYVLGSLALVVPLGLGLAILLNRKLPLRALFRTVLVVPWVITPVATALLWSWLLNAQYGPVNDVLRGRFGMAIDFLGQPRWAMPSLILANTWGSYPYAMVLMLAGLQTVSEDLLEAATMDGASSWRQFWSITLPLLQNHLLVAVILLGINFFNQVTLPLILTGGGPLNATYVMGVRVYNEALSFYHMDLAASIAVYMLLFNLVFTLLYIRVLRRESLY